MAACSSSTPTPDIFQAIDVALGLVTKSRDFIPEPPTASYADRLSVTTRIHDLFSPFTHHIFSYALNRHRHVFFGASDINFSPKYFKNLPCRVSIRISGEFFVLFPTFTTRMFRTDPQRFNITLPFPPHVATELEICAPSDKISTTPTPPIVAPPETPKPQEALYQRIQTTLDPHLESLSQYVRQISHHIFEFYEYLEGTQLLPSGLFLDHLYFQHLSHSVIVGTDKKVSILSGNPIPKANASGSDQELLYPQDIQQILNEIDTLLGRLPAPKGGDLTKFPAEKALQPEAVEQVRTLITSQLETLFQALAKKISHGMRFSRRMYEHLPYSLYLFPSGKVAIHTSILKGMGAFRKIKRIIEASPAMGRYVISSPRDAKVKFLEEIWQEQRFRSRLDGRPGFLKYEADYVQDSCRFLKPLGSVTNEFSMNGDDFYKFLKLRARAAEKKAPDPVLLTFIKNTLNALETLHERNIYHLDLAGRNLLASEEGDAAIIDFGLSYDPLRPGTLHCGAYAYTPPEINILNRCPISDTILRIIMNLPKPQCSSDRFQWKGQTYSTDQLEKLYTVITHEVCHAYDIWSLGICFFTLITGRPYLEMFCETEHRAQRNATLLEHQNIYDHLGISPEQYQDNPLVPWVLQMLAVDPSARPTVAELKKTLSKSLH